MAKLATMALTGASGQQYNFNVYSIDTEFQSLGAVYYVSRRTMANQKGSHTEVYIGQSGDISERFENHHKAYCFHQHGANCISIHADDNEFSRLDKEQDLIQAYNPPCND
ncbi:MAG: GIY-YIG nuclease family protein [Candidatus Thiodiazotropha endolucinida]